VIYRAPACTRPLSLSNTNNKLIASAINRPLSSLCQATVAHQQFGNVRGRSLVSNIVKIETHTLQSVMRRLSHPGCFFFDTAAAFPSMDHRWIRAVTSRMSIPAPILHVLNELYRSVRAFIVCCGLDELIVNIECGIKQGCPSSGSIWALCFDPCIRAVVSRLPRDALFAGYADDLAIALRNVFEGIVPLWLVLCIIRGATGLSQNAKKTVLLMLWQQPIDVVRRRIASMVPALASIRIEDYAEHLGIMIGPGMEAVKWNKASARYREMVLRCRRMSTS